MKSVYVKDTSKYKLMELAENPSHFFFPVDASQAGAGHLEIVISANGRNVPNFVQSEGNAKFKVSFTPQEAVPHQIRVRFNNHVVPGKLSGHHSAMQRPLLLLQLFDQIFSHRYAVRLRHH